MEEKKKIKISLKTAILSILIILAIIFGIIFLIYNIQTTPSSNSTVSTGFTSTTTIYSDTKKDIPTNSNTKYNIYSTYLNYSSNVELDNIFVTSNNELEQYLYKCIGKQSVYITSENDNTFYTNYTNSENENTSIIEYFNDDFFEKHNLAIEMYEKVPSSNHNYSIISVVKNDTTGTINIKDNFYTYGDGTRACIKLDFITLDKEIKNVNFDIYRTTTNNSYESNFEMMFIAGIIILITVIIIVSVIVSRHNHKVANKTSLNSNTKKHKTIKRVIISIIIAVLIVIVLFFAIVFYEAVMMPNTIVYKPIIYLYPTEEIKLSVGLGNKENITCSYPQYIDGWNVLAKPNGDLVDLNTKRTLYSLYYESRNAISFNVKEDGFIVQGKDTITFLEEKLAILGLTEREAEEFIVYWLPKLEANKYNYIRFATLEEINANMPLNFSVEPDTLIRVLMTYKGLDKPIDIKEQTLEKVERKGFVVVEWGGTEIK